MQISQTLVESAVSCSAVVVVAIVLDAAAHNLNKPMSDAHIEESNDSELAARMAQRDRSAFEQLYDRYASKAFGLVLRLLGDRAVSEDVLQESFWRAWQRASSYDPTRASFSSWMLSIAHHTAIDELRRRRSRTKPDDVELDATEDGETRDIEDGQADVAETAWSNVISENVRIAIEGLPKSQRRVIELAYFGGFTRQEIAAQLQEPLGTVHTRVRLGLLKLRETLANLNA